jgi:hypothetical protein
MIGKSQILIPKDKFMQRLRERNFLLVIEEERRGSEDPAVIQTYFTSESKVAYSKLWQILREAKCRIVIVSLVI